MKLNFGHKKVCFLCSGKINDKDYGYLEYSFKEKDGSRGTDKKKICALCCEKVDSSTTIIRGMEDEQE